MAINKVVFPTTPNPVAGDWAKIVALMSQAFQNINNPLQVNSSNIPQGSTFQVGGAVYHADSDTGISGTPSEYVKLAISGDTLVPSFVVDLTGVTWNKVYNGYYDSSDDYYIFDEAAAILDGELSASNTKFSELWNEHIGQDLKTTDDVEFGSLVCSNIDTGNGATEIYDMNQDVRSDDNVVFSNITINGTILPTTSPVRSSYSLVDGVAYTLSRGFWLLSFDATPVGNITVEINVASTWYAVLERRSSSSSSESKGIGLFSDGTNIRVICYGSAYTFYYHKF